MIPGFILAVFGSKVGRMVLLVLAAVIAFVSYSAWLEHRGYVHALEKAKAATEAESARRLQALEETQADAQKKTAQLHSMEMKYAALQQESARASAAVDRVPCHDRAGVARVRAFGRPTGSGTQKPTRRAAH